MTKLLILLILLAIPSCEAKTGLAAFDEYLRSQNIPIDGVSGSGPTARIDYKTEATKQQKEFGDAAKLTFDWSDKPDPDYTTFKSACYTDGLTNKADIPLINVLADPAISDGVRKALWSKVKGSAATAKIEQYAQDAHVVIK